MIPQKISPAALPAGIPVNPLAQVRMPIPPAQAAIQSAHQPVVSKPIVPVQVVSISTFEKEADQLEVMIQKHQTIVKVEESKWFGNKDVTSHKHEIARLVHDLINALEKLINIQLPLFNTRDLSPKEEIQFGKLLERVLSACELGGKEYSKNAEKAKAIRNDVCARIQQIETWIKRRDELKQKITSFEEWVKIPEKHETIRGIFGLWNSQSAAAEIGKMNVQLAKIEVEYVEEDVAAKFKNTNSLSVLTGGLKDLIDKKQALVALLPQGSLDRMNVEREIRKHESEIQKLNK